MEQHVERKAGMDIAGEKAGNGKMERKEWERELTGRGS